MKVNQQSKDWNCGVFSIYHCFKHLDLEFDPVKETKKFKRVIPKQLGLSPVDILNILNAKGVGYEELICASNENENTWLKQVKRKLKDGSPLILLTDDWAHWLVVIDYKNSKFTIADSASASGRTGQWSETTLLKKSRNPGIDSTLKRMLPTVFGIDNLYAISVEV
jgi:ABC-type bacteriocin/lantibiotic exporter with double-glycine peptidase domain